MFTSLLLAVAGMAPTAAVARADSSLVATSIDDSAAAGSAIEFSGRGLLTEQVRPQGKYKQRSNVQIAQSSHSLTHARAPLGAMRTSSMQAGRCGQLCALLAMGGVLDMDTHLRCTQ